MKLHLRLYKFGPRTLRVLTPRPGTPVSFSNNYFHDTWHILSGAKGAHFLARLLWALSYQTKPGTVILIDGPYLVSNPFEADKAIPILLCNSDLGRPDKKQLFTLREQITRSRTRPPDGTVRLFSHGLDFARENPWEVEPRWNHPFQRSETCERVAGFIRYSAPAIFLRRAAFRVDRLNFHYGDMDYIDIGFYSKGAPPGEVQIFRDFERMVSTAREARSNVLNRGKIPGPPEHEGDFHEAVWKRAEFLARKDARTYKARSRKRQVKNMELTGFSPLPVRGV